LIDWRTADGKKLYGALLLPSNYEQGKQYPLLVNPYGGNYRSDEVYKFGLSGTGINNMQLFATRGYAVLLPDAPLGIGNPMEDLAKTILPGLDKVIEMGIADHNRLGIMGHSYGGYSTLALIAQTTRFKAAVSSAGIGNILGYYGSLYKDGKSEGIGWAEDSQGRMGGSPWQYRDRYIENSPFFYLDRVQTPLLLVHGSEDQIPAYLADEVFVGLRRLGKEVVYARYQGEQHSLSSRPNQIDYLTRVIAWFDRYLKAPETKDGKAESR
jgi:dipeptidyl aminopeptidase/acylaminoacyl peptidase